MNSYTKYNSRGPGFHWEHMSRSLRKRNLFTVARYAAVLDLIKSEIHGEYVLDLGCGDGVLSFLLAKSGAHIIGVDVSLEAVKYAKSKCIGFRFAQFGLASVYALPFCSNFIDYIVACEIIEHLRYPEGMLSEMNRIWNGSGKLIISTPIRKSVGPHDSMHKIEYFVDDFFDLLKKNFPNCKISIHQSHPICWQRFQSKKMLNRNIPKFLLNLFNLIFNINPFRQRSVWKYYAQQIAVISK